LEVDRAVTPVGHHDVATLPRHRVVGMHARLRVDTLEPEASRAPCRAAGRAALGADRLRHVMRPLRHYSSTLIGSRFVLEWPVIWQLRDLAVLCFGRRR